MHDKLEKSQRLLSFKNLILDDLGLPLNTHAIAIATPTCLILSYRLPIFFSQKTCLQFRSRVMETPSSTRRVTRSQTLSAIKSSATNHLLSSKESDKSQSKSRQRNGAKPQQERSALFDITNDSPIVGLAMQTPSSGVMGKRNVSRIKSTPGSGEALLRGQVKTLLQKVEEEAHGTKISAESRPFVHLVTSPMGLLAPTPANTPQVVDFSDGLQIVITSPVVPGQATSQVEEKAESLEVLERSPSITRSLMLDFSDKLELWEDDNSSVWSMQVNASTKDEEDEVCSYREEDDEAEEYSGEAGTVDELCEGMRKMSFAGKHTRFVYDSEDEEILEAQEQPRVLRLKGFPTPKGKHVRFSGDE
ncbi:unnamed protein product [Thlaspi arvense]|uniref:Uncharacterized protein n=1 Tax=Thlaspi arvense TaxID=13288 RepID=A0AAU9RHF7_THLAR|nr:unnamed protein product [Thlaspi arvense]